MTEPNSGVEKLPVTWDAVRVKITEYFNDQFSPADKIRIVAEMEDENVSDLRVNLKDIHDPSDLASMFQSVLRDSEEEGNTIFKGVALFALLESANKGFIKEEFVPQSLNQPEFKDHIFLSQYEELYTKLRNDLRKKLVQFFSDPAKRKEAVSHAYDFEVYKQLGDASYRTLSKVVDNLTEADARDGGKLSTIFTIIEMRDDIPKSVSGVKRFDW